MTLERYKEAMFPNLNPGEYRVTSEASPVYNCIAWAAGDDTDWWWPDPDSGNYWPAAAPFEETLASFRAVFEALGYRECATAEREPGFEKVALFVDDDGLPTHAARQLPNGNWTSKLGKWQDIEHQYLNALAGSASLYGNVALLLRRRSGNPPQPPVNRI